MEKFNKLSLRLATFESDNWPSGKPDTKALAEAGFYYEGVRDVTTCYSCNFKLHGWEPKDDPWQEHEKTKYHCNHLQNHKDKVAKRSQEQEKPSRDPGVSKPAPTAEGNKKKSSDKEKSSKPKKEKKEKKRHIKTEKETQMAEPEVTSTKDNSQGQEMEVLKKEIEELKEAEF